MDLIADNGDDQLTTNYLSRSTEGMEITRTRVVQVTIAVTGLVQAIQRVAGFPHVLIAVLEGTKPTNTPNGMVIGPIVESSKVTNLLKLGE